jgi:hypothetical protein
VGGLGVLKAGSESRGLERWEVGAAAVLVACANTLICEGHQGSRV